MTMMGVMKVWNFIFERKYQQKYILFFFFSETQYDKNEYLSPSASSIATTQQQLHGNNLNINVPENNAILRLEVELRDKHTAGHQRRGRGGGGVGAAGVKRTGHQANNPKEDNVNYMVPMEKVSIPIV